MVSVSLKSFAPVLLIVLLVSSAISLLTSTLLLKYTIDDSAQAARETMEDVYNEATNTLDIAIEQADEVTRQLTQELANATVNQLSTVLSALFLRYNTSTLILQQMVRYFKADLTTLDGLLDVLDHVDNLRRVVGDDMIPIASVHAAPLASNIRSAVTSQHLWSIPTPTVISRISDDRFVKPAYSYALVVEVASRMPSWARTSHVVAAANDAVVATIVTLDTFSWQAPPIPVDDHCNNATVRALFLLDACGVITGGRSDGTAPFVGLPARRTMDISRLVQTSRLLDEPRGEFTDAHLYVTMLAPLMDEHFDVVASLNLGIRMDVIQENVDETERRVSENVNQTVAASGGPAANRADRAAAASEAEAETVTFVGDTVSMLRTVPLRTPSVEDYLEASTRHRKNDSSGDFDGVFARSASSLADDSAARAIGTVSITPLLFVFDQGGHLVATSDKDARAQLDSRAPQTPLVSANGTSSKLITAAYKHITNPGGVVMHAPGVVSTVPNPLGDGDDWYLLLSVVSEGSLAGREPVAMKFDGTLYCVIMVSEAEVLQETRVRGAFIRDELLENYTLIREVRKAQDDDETSSFWRAVIIQIIVTLICVAIEVLVVFLIAWRLSIDVTIMQDALDDVAAMDLDAGEETLTGKPPLGDKTDDVDSNAALMASALDEFRSSSYISEVSELQRGMLGMILTLREYRRYLPAWLKDDGGEAGADDESTVPASRGGRPEKDGSSTAGSERGAEVRAPPPRGRRRDGPGAARVAARGNVAAHLLTETGLTPRKVAAVLIALPFVRDAAADPLEQVMPARPPSASSIIKVLNEALAIAEPIGRQHRVTVAPDVSSSLGAIPSLVVLCNAEIPTARAEVSALEMAVAFEQQARRSDTFQQLGVKPFIAVCAGAAGAGPIGTSTNRWFLVVSSVMLRLRALAVYAMAKRISVVADEVAFSGGIAQSSFRAAAIEVIRVRTSAHSKATPEVETAPFATRALSQTGDAVVANLDQPERFVVYAVLGRQAAEMDEWMYELEKMEQHSSNTSASKASIGILKALHAAKVPADLKDATELIGPLRNPNEDELVLAPFFERLADVIVAGSKGEIELPHAVTISTWTAEKVV